MRKLFGFLFLCAFSYNLASQPLVSNFKQFKGLKELSVTGSIKVILLYGQHEGYGTDDKVSSGNSGIKESFSKGRLTLITEPKVPDQDQIVIYVYFKTLVRIFTNGNAMLVCPGRIEQPSINLYASGNSSMQLELLVRRLKAELDGQAVVTLRGRGVQETVNTDGLSKFLAGDFKCETVFARAESDSEILVYVEKEMRTNGSENIRYLGNPASVDGDNTSRY